MKNWIWALGVPMALGACNASAPDGSGDPGNYARPGVTLATVGESFETEDVLHLVDGATVTRETVQTVVEPTADPDVVYVTFNGERVELTLDGSGFYLGNSGGVEVVAREEWADTEGYLRDYFVSIRDGAGTRVGYALLGIETDPAEIAALSGSANYSGLGTLALSSENSANYTYSYGVAALTALFGATPSISGTLDLQDTGEGSGITVPTGTITLNSTSISGNSYAGTTDAVAGDLGLDTLDGLTWLGKFYGINGSATGGRFAGEGTLGGETVFIDGIFVAE